MVTRYSIGPAVLVARSQVRAGVREAMTPPSAGETGANCVGGVAQAELGSTMASEPTATAAVHAAHRIVIECTQRSGIAGVAPRHNLGGVLVPVLAACCALMAAPSPSAAE